MKNIGTKEQFIPSQLIGNGKKLIMWDLKKENNYYTWVEMSFPDTAGKDIIQDTIINYYDLQVRNKILDGFSWKNMKIRLTMENQYNYKGLYDRIENGDLSVFPLKLRFGEKKSPVYYTFKEKKEYEEFYFAFTQYIYSCIQEGWKIKDSIDWSLY